jgi:hypothetical protein
MQIANRRKTPRDTDRLKQMQASLDALVAESRSLRERLSEELRKLRQLWKRRGESSTISANGWEALEPSAPDSDDVDRG